MFSKLLYPDQPDVSACFGLRADDPRLFKQRCRACLAGSAAGDALGYAIEFDDEPAIFDLYGPDGIQNYELSHKKALVSDDTQMSLFTGAGLLAGFSEVQKNRPSSFPISEPWASDALKALPAGCGNLAAMLMPEIWQAYQDWLITQDESWKPERPAAGLLQIEDLYAWRAPGMTCLSALRNQKPGSIGCSINNSKGCGGIMRVAPVAVALSGQASLAEIAWCGAQCAALTHSHPDGWISAAFQSVLLAILLNRTDKAEHAEILHSALEQTSATIQQTFGQWPQAEGLIKGIRRTIQLAGRKTLSDLQGIHELGEGWVGEEALYIGVFCTLRHPDDFSAALRASVNHKGDSDSTGAVAGSIMGALCSDIPSEWLSHLEMADLIDEMSWKLAALNLFN